MPTRLVVFCATKRGTSSHCLGHRNRAVDRKVLVRQKARDLGMTQNGCEELGSDIGAKQPLPGFENVE